MIISLDKKFVCLNPPKTGTGYREGLLLPYTDLSYVHISDKMQNLLDDLNITVERFRHLNYSQSSQFIRSLGLDDNEFYFFTFVRNPWHRMVSHFNMSVQQNPNLVLTKECCKAWMLRYFTQENPHISYTQEDFCRHDGREVDLISSLNEIKRAMDFLNQKLKLNVDCINHTPQHSSLHHKIYEFLDNEIIDLIATKEHYIISKMQFTYSEFNHDQS